MMASMALYEEEERESTEQEGGIGKPRRMSLLGTRPAGILILDFPGWQEINVCCLNLPAHATFLWQSKLTNTTILLFNE